MDEDEVLTEDGAEEIHAPNDAVILSYSQMPVNYNAVPKVWLTHPDSTEEAPVLVPFSYGDAVSNVEVVPDFSAGDQLVEAAAGTLIKSAILKKPDTLVPENIAKGVEISGVVGTHKGTPAAGGSGVQKGAVLEIDMEESSVFWARNMATAGQINLVFTETVTQTGNTLEVL